MKKEQIKTWGMDIIIDVIGGFLIALGFYNFAVAANFPLTGVSGIALIFFKLFGFPIGVTTIIINIPVAFICFRLLGKTFFLKSIKSMIITSIMIDVVAPLLPLYTGDPMLAAICTGVISGLGLAMIYMRGSSTGGTDFIIMAIKSLSPHLSLGKISFGIEMVVIAASALTVFRNIDGIIYGILINFMLSAVVDKVMYGIDAGKVAFIVTDNGQAVAEQIDKMLDRGSTLLRGVGSYSKETKEVVMCACNNKQMFGLRKLIKDVDKKAFLVIMESNEVIGEGFKTD